MIRADHDVIFSLGGLTWDVSGPLLMGILNITPDSFFDGGRYADITESEKRIDRMIEEGVDILDIGACSSRPGAEQISLEEEWMRLVPHLEMINKRFKGIVLSLDTFHSEIASRAVRDYGVGIINDISAGLMDEKMPGVVAKLGVPYIMMHMKGTPKTMQDQALYNDVVREIIDFFRERIEVFREAGVNDIVIDPGFGFGKTLDQNYDILSKLEDFQIFDLPLMAGLSRKSMIYKFLDQSPAEALPGTIALNMVALQKGAAILRVHDVAEAVVCRKMHEKLSSSQ